MAMAGVVRWAMLVVLLGVCLLAAEEYWKFTATNNVSNTSCTIWGITRCTSATLPSTPPTCTLARASSGRRGRLIAAGAGAPAEQRAAAEGGVGAAVSQRVTQWPPAAAAAAAAAGATAAHELQKTLPSLGDRDEKWDTLGWNGLDTRETLQE
ncbi:Protein of unknown function [Gryllus bimaculatus]|nr:Protein of unknown function [Gryllus bimaculatus]